MDHKQNGTKHSEYQNGTSNSMSDGWEKVPPVNAVKTRKHQNNQKELAEKLDKLQQTQKSLDVLCEAACHKSRSMQEQMNELVDLVQTSAVISRPTSQQFGITVRGPPELTSPQPGESAVKRIQQSVTRGEQMQLESKVMELQQQNTQLLRQLQEKDLLTSQQRQRITELENKLANSHSMSSTLDWQQKIDELTHSYKKRFQELEAEMGKLQDENRSLRMKINDMQKHVSRGSPSGMTSSVQPSRMGDQEERIRLLQEQITVCTEDFERERHDRERAHAQLQELQLENQSLLEQLEFYRDQQMSEIQSRRARHNHYRPGMLEQCDAIPSDVVEDCGPPPPEGYDEVDGPTRRPVEM